ncbi:MAG: glycosyltransferase family 2 protein [Bacteroidota bacterium]
MGERKKFISIVTACYNEEGNIAQLYLSIKDIFKNLPAYDYEHVFIDNDSKDRSRQILREIASKDQNVKVIFNTRNFGHIRSPLHAIYQAKGDAIISIVADFQDPPEMIPAFLEKWEEGNKIVIGIKKKSQEGFLMFSLRKAFYSILNKFSDIELVKNFTGFGLYDRSFIEIVKEINDPYPYFRGLIPEFGMQRFEIEYVQPKRHRGTSNQSFITLYDIAMLGFVNYSKIPLRMASFVGFSIAILSFLIALGYLIYKLLFWQEFNLGLAPLVIGLFFFSSVQLIFIGIIGEYVGSILTQIQHTKRPLVIEKERLNF